MTSRWQPVWNFTSPLLMGTATTSQSPMPSFISYSENCRHFLSLVMTSRWCFLLIVHILFPFCPSIIAMFSRQFCTRSYHNLWCKEWAKQFLTFLWHDYISKKECQNLNKNRLLLLNSRLKDMMWKLKVPLFLLEIIDAHTVCIFFGYRQCFFYWIWSHMRF